jgi:hypothetical protein
MNQKNFSNGAKIIAARYIDIDEAKEYDRINSSFSFNIYFKALNRNNFNDK